MYSTTNDLQSQINKTKSIEQLKQLQAETNKQELAPTALEYLLAAAETQGLGNLQSLVQQAEEDT